MTGSNSLLQKISLYLGPFSNDNYHHEQDNYIALIRSINQSKLLINLVTALEAIISECFNVVRMCDDCASCNILELTLGTDFGTDAKRYKRRGRLMK